MNLYLMGLSVLLLVACVVLLVKTLSTINAEDLRSQEQPVEMDDFHRFNE